MIIVPASGEIRRGALLTDSASAQEAIKRIPKLQHEMGQIAAAYVPAGSTTGYSQYGFAPVRLPSEGKVGIGILQDKWGITEARCPELIQLGTKRMGDFLTTQQLNIRVELLDKIMPSILSEFDTLVVFVPKM